ncbi:ORF4 [Beak and feather disease virus]|uniref:ORF4 n=1 Tax=Beak and feather disease virus TaxID=77856 RepID=C8CBW1_BFDV|nr:hypothetical protein [Beak and feather disease virus]AOT22422.1 ORF4 [Beak and feather disease virus]
MAQGGTPCRRARRAVRPESPTSPEGLVCVGGGPQGGPPDTTRMVAPKAPINTRKGICRVCLYLSRRVIGGKLTELNIQSWLAFISDC